MEMLCYLNGEYMPANEASVSVFDIGFLRGFGVFDALPTFNRVPFRLPDHLDRFRSSASHLSLAVPYSDSEMEGIIVKLIESNIPKGKEASIRLLLTGGELVGALEFDPGKPTFAVLVASTTPLEKKYPEEGCSLLPYEHLRPFATAKTNNYIQAVVLQNARKEMRALEVLYTHQGRVLECATSNFFIVQDGTVITAGTDVLKGVTRKVVLELMEGKYPTEERDIGLDEMYEADEAFITSSFKNIVPVVKVGERVIGNGKPGPITKVLMKLFDDYTCVPRGTLKNPQGFPLGSTQPEA